MSMLSKRVIFGGVLIALSIGAAWLDGWLSANALPRAGRFHHGAIVTAVWCVLMGVTAVEAVRLLRAAGHRPFALPAILASIVLIIVPWWTMGGLGLSPEARAHDLQWTLLTLAAVAAVVVVGAVLRGSVTEMLARLAATLFIVVYLGLSAGFAVRLRMDFGGTLGVACLLYYVSVAKISDMGAFFVGSRFGRWRFAGPVSPNKTLEGALAGVAAGVAAGLAYHQWLLKGQLAARGLPGQAFSQILVFAVVVAILGQLGDLVESAIKRRAQAKDSGAMIPGFGGIFDITDSLVLAAPVAWGLLTFAVGVR